MHLVTVGEEGIYLPAAQPLLGVVVVLEYDAHGVYVIYLIERNLLRLHLVVYRVGALHTGLDLVLEPGGVELAAHRFHEFPDYLVAVSLALADLGHNLCVLLRMLVAEGQVLELGLYLEQAEPVGQRRVHIEGLAGDLVLLLGA